MASLGGAGENPIANKDFIINTTGGVGIGTTTPEVALDVAGSIRASDDIVLAGADCAEEFDVDADGDIEDGTVLVIGQDRRPSARRPTTAASPVSCPNHAAATGRESFSAAGRPTAPGCRWR